MNRLDWVLDSELDKYYPMLGLANSKNHYIYKRNCKHQYPFCRWATTTSTKTKWSHRTND